MAQAFETLLQMLSQDNWEVLRPRLAELSDLDHSQLDRVQAAWLALPTDRRRLLIAELGTLADDHVEYIFESINRFAICDADGEVRRLAIENLWECEDPKLVPDLLAIFTQDGEPQVRIAAARALGRFIYLAELDRLPSELQSELEDTLIRSYAEVKDEELRLRILESLGYSARPEVSDLIRDAYAATSTDTMRSALIAMGRSANRIWQMQVLSELRNPLPPLRAQAAWASGELELSDATGELLELLVDVHAEVRHAAIWALGQLGGKEPERALSQLLENTLDADEASWIEEALDHLAFVDDTRDFLLFDFDGAEDPTP